uniref:Uncharacterized protein n=1 Tax=Avena sativa TaxID=4498 RepID=A0ACD6ADQ0_AVESA
MAPPAVYHPSSSKKGAISSTAAATSPLPKPTDFVEEDKKFEYFVVCGYMSLCTVCLALTLLPDWHSSLIIVIMFSYSMAMTLLLLKRRHNNNIKDLPTSPFCTTQECSWMLVVTGIMLISMALTVSAFHPRWDDVVLFVVLSLVAAMCSFLLLKIWDMETQKERARRHMNRPETSTDLP